jgi:3-dehydroquinate synthase
MKKDISDIQVQLGDRSYPIHLGSGAWGVLEDYLVNWTGNGKCMVVTDEKVYSIYPGRIDAMAQMTDQPAEIYITLEGETSKSFQRLEDLCRAMAQRGLDRDSLLIAIGGGVVGDLAGLAASVFLRGIKVVQVPTTLLSMVDSSTGGKTGINLPEGKNLVGTFFQPEAVVADTDTLKTLDPRDWYSGMAEVIKISLTLDPELFNYLEKVEDLGPQGGIDTQRIVAAACRRKAEVVSVDEKEAGPRLVLNFGHTLAHALESSMGLGVIRHGEAVAIGMKAALSLSKERCGLDDAQYDRALAVIEKIPVPDVKLDQDLEGFMNRDKKSVGGRVRCVLLEDIGRYLVTVLDDPGELLRVL